MRAVQRGQRNITPGITSLHTGQNRWQSSTHPSGTSPTALARPELNAALLASRSSGWSSKHLWKRVDAPRSGT
eukprot:12016771-Alexandrium_andersonii.AAC.1